MRDRRSCSSPPLDNPSPPAHRVPRPPDAPPRGCPAPSGAPTVRGSECCCNQTGARLPRSNPLRSPCQSDTTAPERAAPHRLACVRAQPAIANVTNPPPFARRESPRQSLCMHAPRALKPFRVGAARPPLRKPVRFVRGFRHPHHRRFAVPKPWRTPTPRFAP